MDFMRLPPLGSPTQRPHTMTGLGLQSKPTEIKTDLTSLTVAQI
jgi:hypothetical protein